MTNFNEPRNTMVITTKAILLGLKPILLVSHDFEDGMWEFLDSEIINENEACIVSLEEILNLDDTLGVLYDLPLGWKAYRNSSNDAWHEECINI